MNELNRGDSVDYWRPVVGFYASAVLALWALTLGPEPHWGPEHLGLKGPYSAVLAMPGGQSIRVPARAWLPATISLAACVAFGALWLLRSRPRGAWFLAIASIAIVAEGWFAEETVRPPRAGVEARIPTGALVLDLPVSEGYTNAAPQFLAVNGGYRSINGYSGYAPPHFGAMRRALADHRAVAWDAFRRHDDVYVIVREAVDQPFVAWLASQPGAEQAARDARVTLYRLPRTSPATSHAALPLPSPGQAAFDIPE